jgi:ribosomal protein S18 acetylase RimI-like enzyme
MHIVNFQPDMLDAAAELLSARHARERQQRSELPAQFERPEQARLAIQALLDKQPALAFAAIRDGRVIGYLIGNLNFTEIRERHLWVEYAGSAIAPGVDAEVYRDLYARVAKLAVAQGYFRHYVLLPSGDEPAVNAWFCLGFGHEQVHALMTLPSVATETLTANSRSTADVDHATDTTTIISHSTSAADHATTSFGEACNLANVTLRLADKSDEPAVRTLAPTIMQHQVGTPVFGIALPGDAPRLQDGYAGLLDEDDVSFWIATRDGEPLGYQVFWGDAPSASNMLTPEACVSLGVGGTLPAARGLGLGTALVQKGFQHAQAQGYTTCSTDWRMTNLLSSRFWPKLGFHPVAYRLFRHIDPRISWADGRNV